MPHRTRTFVRIAGCRDVTAPCAGSDRAEDHDWADDTVRDERFCSLDGDRYCIRCGAVNASILVPVREESHVAEDC